jgi:hypothetical protein
MYQEMQSPEGSFPSSFRVSGTFSQEVRCDNFRAQQFLCLTSTDYCCASSFREFALAANTPFSGEGMADYTNELARISIMLVNSST